jgi:hypothetical protein
MAVLAFAACGSSSSGGVAKAACQSSCDAMAKGCPASGADYASFCKLFCADGPPACATLYATWAACRDRGGWQCSTTATVNGNPAPEEIDKTGCGGELDAYSTCAQANTRPCKGADDAGACPLVQCACPGGTVSTSGLTGSGSSCTCLDSTTCIPLCN